MANITREEIVNINNKCSNNWILNVPYYLNYREKTFVKRIELDEQNFLEFLLCYNSENKTIVNISKFSRRPDEEIAVSSGIGKTAIINNIPVVRKNINKLIEYTKELTDEKLLEINQNTEVNKSNGLFLQSEDF